MEGRPTDDAELFARAQRGETAAYEEIVQRYQQLAFRTAYVITGSASDAEDAAQEAWTVWSLALTGTTSTQSATEG